MLITYTVYDIHFVRATQNRMISIPIMWAQEPRNGYLQILITPVDIEQLDCVRFYLQGKYIRL